MLGKVRVAKTIGIHILYTGIIRFVIDRPKVKIGHLEVQFIYDFKSSKGALNPSYYGHICPIDTSEGTNVGIIGSLAIHARVGHRGSIESPFYQISEKRKKEEAQVVYLSPNRDEYYMVAVGNSLALNRCIQKEEFVPARYRQDFLTIAWEMIHLRSIFPFNYFSVGASLIPFIEHNDANRALMSSNMQRQVIPLFRSEKCIVGSGLEGQTALDSGVLLIADHLGKVIYTDTHKILLSSH